MGFSLPYPGSDTGHISLARTGQGTWPCLTAKGAGKGRKADGRLGEHSSLSHTMFGPPNVFLFSVLQAILTHFLG